jgi:cytochrome oxidase Cu insertion factor (SCO1/SenC/PrrC family)
MRALQPALRLVAAAATLLVACQPPAAPPGNAVGPAAPATAPPRELRVGDAAPDFTLVDQNRQEVNLGQLRGRPVQVAFYVWALSPG